jgi:hypothetical protein
LHTAVVMTVLATAAVPVADDPQPVMVTYLYNLSNATGQIPFNAPALAYDESNHELFVHDNLIHVFNESGMETFAFGNDPEVGGMGAIAALEDGDLLALTSRDGKPTLTRCNFRGEFVARIEITGVPPELANFRAGTMRYRNGRVYLPNLGETTIVVVGLDGKFQKFFDVAAMLQLPDKRADLGFKGFNVDKSGNMLFTIQPLFHAYRLTLEGQIKEFGQRGSAPGKFNIVGGIAADENGYLYVSDILKSAVLVFDPEYRWIKEFGYRGRRPGSLTAPVEIEAANGKLYVSQYGRRGVAVFKIEVEPRSS